LEDDDYYEKPQHKVSVPAFLMGKYPVTQAQWRFVAALSQEKIVLEAELFDIKGDNRPVANISWNEAEEFCQRLSRKTNCSYRLPSEAEWEYGCRAGTTTSFYFGDAWRPEFIAAEASCIVGSCLPNAFGLYDMHGNVWELCADPWHSNYESAPADGTAWLKNARIDRGVIRGGAFNFVPASCRSSSRMASSMERGFANVGFRLACEISPGHLS
jgi:formylglycine-generating enzyme required for sulfatase activity